MDGGGGGWDGSLALAQQQGLMWVRGRSPMCVTGEFASVNGWILPINCVDLNQKGDQSTAGKGKKCGERGPSRSGVVCEHSRRSNGWCEACTR